MTTKKPSAYTKAGVDIDVMAGALRRAKRSVRSTNTPGVLSDVGSFGGLFKSPGRDHVLVSSIDGVGTKLMVASRVGRHDTVGQDLVNHCVNDILVQGAKPLFFMDYLGTARLEPKVFAEVLAGLSKACRQNGCALIGGETAEMPGLYPQGEYDLVGAVIGTVARKRLVTGKAIRAGDVIIGLPSSGLHTNGYSLARDLLFKKARLSVNDPLPGTRTTVGAALLKVHRSYLAPVTALLEKVPVRGMAHITGGGLVDNLPRVLPEGLEAVIDTTAWRVPPLFRFLEEAGEVAHDEMFRVFNMGIGYTVLVRPRDAEQSLHILRKAGLKPAAIGYVAKGRRGVRLRMRSESQD